jgi:hypothetical protein
MTGLISGILDRLQTQTDEVGMLRDEEQQLLIDVRVIEASVVQKLADTLSDLDITQQPGRSAACGLVPVGLAPVDVVDLQVGLHAIAEELLAHVELAEFFLLELVERFTLFISHRFGFLDMPEL